MAVENGTNSFMPSKLLSKFESDISPLMAFLGDESDYILYENTPPQALTVFWNEKGFQLPSFIRKNQLNEVTVNKIAPWGWSQIINSKFMERDSQLPIFSSTSKYRQFFSRQTSLQLCNELSKKALPEFVSIPHLPKRVSSLADVSLLLDKHAGGIVLKTLWSSSGRGLVFIRDNTQLKNATNWINAQLKKHEALIAEPIYNKLQDASLQFNITETGAYEFLGLNYFDADPQGHFNKEYFHTPGTLVNILPPNNVWIQNTADAIIESMRALQVHEKYHGPIGIDAMFIKNTTGEIKFYPLVEANLRCNMGLVNLHLKQKIALNASGTWEITQFRDSEAPVFYQEHIKKHPLVIENGKIAKGFFPLTPFEDHTRFAAWGIVY
jgi:hypothetical protein